MGRSRACHWGGHACRWVALKHLYPMRPTIDRGEASKRLNEANEVRRPSVSPIPFLTPFLIPSLTPFLIPSLTPFLNPFLVPSLIPFLVPFPIPSLVPFLIVIPILILILIPMPIPILMLMKCRYSFAPFRA